MRVEPLRGPFGLFINSTEANVWDDNLGDWMPERLIVELTPNKLNQDCNGLHFLYFAFDPNVIRDNVSEREVKQKMVPIILASISSFRRSVDSGQTIDVAFEITLTIFMVLLSPSKETTGRVRYQKKHRQLLSWLKMAISFTFIHQTIEKNLYNFALGTLRKLNSDYFDNFKLSYFPLFPASLHALIVVFVKTLPDLALFLPSINKLCPSLERAASNTNWRWVHQVLADGEANTRAQRKRRKKSNEIETADTTTLRPTRYYDLNEKSKEVDPLSTRLRRFFRSSLSQSFDGHP